MVFEHGREKYACYGYREVRIPNTPRPPRLPTGHRLPELFQITLPNWTLYLQYLSLGISTFSLRRTRIAELEIASSSLYPRGTLYKEAGFLSHPPTSSPESNTPEPFQPHTRTNLYISSKPWAVVPTYAPSTDGLPDLSARSCRLCEFPETENGLFTRNVASRQGKLSSIFRYTYCQSKQFKDAIRNQNEKKTKSTKYFQTYANPKSNLSFSSQSTQSPSRRRHHRFETEQQPPLPCVQ